MKGKTICGNFIVAFLPIVFLWTGLNFDRKNYPNDPEYIYLMNALCLCDGQSVGYIDNPGTTLIQFSAATLALKHLFSPDENTTIIEHVLKQPGSFIESIRKGLVVLNAILLLILGWVIFRKTNSVWRALFLQLCMVISTFLLIITWVSLSPEPLLFTITGLFILLVFLFYHDDNKTRWNYVFLFALITGVGLGTKATFLPLAVFPLFVLPNFKKKMIYLLAIVPAFVLSTLPAIPEYDQMYFWFRDMISHSGVYGQGKRQFIDFSVYLPNIRKILVENPLLPVTLSATAVALIVGFFYRKEQKFRWDLRFLTGLFSVFIFGILLVAKHYGGNHYLIPVMLLSGISFYIVIDFFMRFWEIKTLKTFLFPVVVAGLLLFVWWNHPGKIITSKQQYQAASKEISSADLWVEKNFADYTQINYYIYSINKFTGLKFGNDFAKRKMLPYLKKAFPHVFFYELSSDAYLNWNIKTSLQDIVEKHGNKILLMNAPNDKSQITELEKRGFPLKQVYDGEAQDIYVLDTVKYIQPPKQIFNKVGSTILFDTEHFSDDGKYFLGNNNEIFGPVNALSTKEARSGQNSIKLEKSNPFAVEYTLKDIKPGDRFQIDVWRKTKRANGYLVVAAENPETFYIAQNEALKYEENTWGLLRVIVDVTPETEGKTLKIYLWNPGSSVAYFDDLRIQKFSAVSK